MGYYLDLYGPAIYDVFFDHGKEGARVLVETIREHLRPDMQVLDVATGTGFAAFEIAPLVPEGYVLGIDIEEDAILLAGYKAGKSGLRNIGFRTGDALSLDFDDCSFDVALGSQTFGDIDFQKRSLAEMVRVLRPGGLVGLVRPHPPGCKVYQALHATMLELAARHGKGAPDPLRGNPAADPSVIADLFAQSDVITLFCEQFAVAGARDFARSTLNLVSQTGSMDKLVTNILGLAEGDRESIITGTLDWLEIGQKIREERYGGQIDLEFLIAVGRKPEQGA
jgi:SAM-dependent methyltransferase